MAGSDKQPRIPLPKSGTMNIVRIPGWAVVRRTRFTRSVGQLTVNRDSSRVCTGLGALAVQHRRLW